MRKFSYDGSNATLKSRTYSTTALMGGFAGVKVHDLIEVHGTLIRYDWYFEFLTEPGDLKAQIEARLLS
ncbi:MAG: hypothetical protein AAF317_15570 [Pseudomonadota bacterium]